MKDNLPSRNKKGETKEEHLPVFGVGPYYVAGITAADIIGIIMSAKGFLKSGQIDTTPAVLLMTALGAVLIIGGILVWKASVAGRKSIVGYIESNTLCTTGVYSIVRNPCYSGIMLVCTGVLLISHNLWLLILPPIYWIAMTVLMKCTEEKWLYGLYGQEYLEYCKKVNRCIPWFPKKNYTE
ncbi:MAG: isoprenylcysteine carboxylmethyltransferase family protein [Bacillota bacterium]|nr:isoprenylcysteine carboxylmethyltransferase family protein [Bacillota bacterium]